MRKDESKKKVNKQLWGESKPSEIKAHKELAHEDRDPIYPIDPIIEIPREKKQGQ